MTSPNRTAAQPQAGITARRASFAIALAGACAALALAAAPGAALAQTTLKFSHTDTPVGARQKAAELFAKKVEEYTQGRYKVQIFHSGQLANDTKSLEQLQLGGLDFAVTGASTYAPHLKELNLLSLPYLVDTYEQGWKLYDDSKWTREQFEKLAATRNIRILSTWEAGFRSFSTKRPFTGPDDIKGTKLRAFKNDMFLQLLTAMGWNPVVMPVTEAYLAIQQGVVEGQENPIDTIYSQKFYEVAPILTLTEHVYSPIPMAISQRTWAKLSAQDQAGVRKAALESAAFSRQEVKGNDDKVLAEMVAKGAKVNRIDKAVFRKAMEPVYESARKEYGKDVVDGLLGEAAQLKR
ncbi:MAG: TRAP transporter substrate-binding protein [Lautropia sp.]